MTTVPKDRGAADKHQHTWNRRLNLNSLSLLLPLLLATSPWLHLLAEQLVCELYAGFVLWVKLLQYICELRDHATYLVVLPVIIPVLYVISAHNLHQQQQKMSPQDDG